MSPSSNVSECRTHGDAAMTEAIEPAEYAPSPWDWVREQVEEYEASDGTKANTLLDTGLAIIIVRTTGAKTGAIRKTPLMRVEHEGSYALVASMGGAPKHPVWYFNLLAHPDEVWVQDGPAPFPVDIREVEGAERRRSGGSVPSRRMRRTPSTRRTPTGRSRSSSPRRADRTTGHPSVLPPRVTRTWRPSRAGSRRTARVNRAPTRRARSGPRAGCRSTGTDRASRSGPNRPVMRDRCRRRCH